jgi:uncharacterized protein with HEPN domain
MLSREERDRNLLHDALEYANHALKHLADVDLDAFLADEVLQGDIIYRVFVVGEALHQVSDEYKSKHPELPYGPAYAMRNILAHAYGKIDVQRVWDTVKDDLPGLIENIKSNLNGV